MEGFLYWLVVLLIAALVVAIVCFAWSRGLLGNLGRGAQGRGGKLTQLAESATTELLKEHWEFFGEVGVCFKPTGVRLYADEQVCAQLNSNSQVREKLGRLIKTNLERSLRRQYPVEAKTVDHRWGLADAVLGYGTYAELVTPLTGALVGAGTSSRASAKRLGGTASGAGRSSAQSGYGFRTTLKQNGQRITSTHAAGVTVKVGLASDNDIQLSRDEYGRLAAHHVELRRDGGQLYVANVSGQTSVYVGGEPLESGKKRSYPLSGGLRVALEGSGGASIRIEQL